MRPLNIRRTSTGFSLEDPVVVETSGAPVLAAELSLDGSVLRYNSSDQAYEFDVQENGYAVSPDARTLVIKGVDDDFAVRRVTDDDGEWASKTKAPAPSDSLEKLALGGPYMSSAPYANTDESLWVAVDADTEDVRELVYSSPSGMYARSSGGWFRYPDNDTSLDGVESIDVSGDFVHAFDAAEQKNVPLSRDDVLDFQVDGPAEEVGETATEDQEAPEPESPSEE